MKDYIPRYDKKNGEIERIYNKLKPVDKKIINSFILKWNTTASKIKVTSKKNSLIRIADIIESGINKISKDDYLRLAGLIRSSDLADSSKNDLRKYFKEFIRDYYLDWNIRFGNLKEFRLMKESIPKKYESLPSIADYGKLIVKTDSLLLKTFIQAELETASRPSELIRCKWGDYNEDKNELKLISTKNKTIRIIPLNKTIPHLKRWKKEFMYEFPTKNDFIFPSSKDRDKSVNLDYIDNRLRKLGKQVLGRPISVYCLRHSVLTFFQTKLPTKVYEKVADHSIETASRYSHLNNQDIKEAMEELVYKVIELEPSEREEMKKEIDSLKSEMKIKDNSIESIKNNYEELNKGFKKIQRGLLEVHNQSMKNIMIEVKKKR